MAQSSPRLKVVPAPESKPARTPRTAPPKGVIGQVRMAFAREHRLAAIVGLLLGGIVPALTYMMAHAAGALVSLPAVIALGGLAYSAPTVYGWARAAFGDALKAAGFVLLLEGVMVSAGSVGLAWLGWVALAYLVAINATATACRLALGK